MRVYRRGFSDLETRIALHCERVSMHLGLPPKHPGYPRPCRIRRLSDGSVFNLASVKEACVFAGVKYSRMHAALMKNGKVFAGFEWTLGESDRRRSEQVRGEIPEDTPFAVA